MPDLVAAPGSTTSTGAEEFHVGFLGFPNLTQLDLTGPFETLARLPGIKVHIVARTLKPIRSDTGFIIQPTTSYADCPSLDLICVPAGPGRNDVMLVVGGVACVSEQ